VTSQHAAVFSLGMLCSTPAGDAHTFSEPDGMFRRAGLARNTFRSPGPGGRIVISQR